MEKLAFDYSMFCAGFSSALACALLGLFIGAPIRALFNLFS